MEFIESETQMNNLLNAILEMESIHSPPLSPLYKSPQTRTTTSTPPPSLATSTEQMREVIYSMAAMQPIKIDPEEVRPPKRRNVKISNDPQSVAARLRRERISERIRILQRMVPGGTRMDTASMLDEVIHYVKFLKRQVQNGASSLSTPRSFNDRLLYLR